VLPQVERERLGLPDVMRDEAGSPLRHDRAGMIHVVIARIR
jgi:hypothetical protein